MIANERVCLVLILIRKYEEEEIYSIDMQILLMFHIYLFYFYVIELTSIYINARDMHLSMCMLCYSSKMIKHPMAWQSLIKYYYILIDVESVVHQLAINISNLFTSMIRMTFYISSAWILIRNSRIFYFS